ncbi:GerAB/ArcD/ProY family transporter [Sporosarcina sp. Te-1]|uniref:GerAB/ArcD/ProY family transporter n=1 Tax=Sporosarcina sp. Te-1 TaxID=2818390 RepID=UPI001A9F2A70|nr:GerAB/ArcD/ProY family transporter [Sporosarcina sp. Te-1]QTD43044.1 GerAB/ArcD/ProY family transporter [Sporosarcina sp. Te-1]
MNRFLYYFIILNMIVNMVVEVPKILIDFSHRGAITSIALALIIGVALNWILIKLFQPFPARSLPELLQLYTPGWLNKLILLYLSVNWFVAGLLSISTFTLLLKRFLTPEMSSYIIVSSFVFLVSYGILMKSKSLLNSMEIIMILNIPIVLFLIAKVYLDQTMDWDYVKVALTYVNNWPNYSAVTAAIYPMIGIVNIVIFNRYLISKVNMRLKHLLIIFLVGGLILFTTYFIPLGYIGFDVSENIQYPWILTSDSVRLKYGLIERFIFIFLLIFLSLSFLNITIHWHVAQKLLEAVYRTKKLVIKGKDFNPYLWILLFWGITFIVAGRMTEYQLFLLGKYFFNQQPLFAIVLIGSLLLIKRGAKKHE